MTRPTKLLSFYLSMFVALHSALADDASSSSKARALIGAYYFDGWNGVTGISPVLRTEFAERKPLWGWKDDTVEIMQKQIDYAADHQIGFWAFDWYYPEAPKKDTPLNNASDLFLKATNRTRMQFCLLVANHGGYRIGPDDWQECCRRWIDLFQQPTYLRVNGKPLLIFFLPRELQKAFGSTEAVQKAFAELREMERERGIKEIMIAGCIGQDTQRIKEASQQGYDLLTGYCHNFAWQDGSGSKPFRKWIERNEKAMDRFANTLSLPYVPVITIGWLSCWEIHSA